MEMREITERYAVAPQIDPADAPEIAAEGVTLVICNRPDEEVPPSHQAAELEKAVRAAGMEFAALPLTHQTMTPENVAKQAELVEAAGGKVLAYCASGTRCSVVWALGQAGARPTDEILSMTARAGYMLDGLRPTLEAMARG